MFNLLSNKEKQAIRREYRYRLLACFLYFLTAIIFCSAVFLLPSYFASKGKKAELENVLKDSAYSVLAKEEGELSALVKIAKDKVAALGNATTTAEMNRVFDEVARAKPEKIKLSSFIFQKPAATEKDSRGEVTVAGESADRDALLVFKQNLEKSGNFSEVSLPVSSFAAANNITFSISLRGSF